jgi:hypothetical protein
MATTLENVGLDVKRSDGDAGMAFRMTLIMAMVTIAGFAYHFAMGRSTFAVPWPYHVHGAVFFCWVALFVIQTRFADRGTIALHRRLGWIAALLLPLVLVMGAMIVSLRRSGGPFFFAQNEFLWGNLLLLPCFGGLVVTAVLRRRETDWHSRLMLTSMATLTGPGISRLLPMPLMIPWSWHVTVMITLVFPIAGMVIDKRKYGAVHSAWLWGAGAVLAVHVLSTLIAYTPQGIALTEAIVVGTPGAERPMKAFLP